MFVLCYHFKLIVFPSSCVLFTPTKLYLNNDLISLEVSYISTFEKLKKNSCLDQWKNHSTYHQTITDEEQYSQMELPSMHYRALSLFYSTSSVV